MKAVYVLPLVLVVSACALSPEKQREVVSMKSTDELCVGYMRNPTFRAAIDGELRARGATCDWNKLQAVAQADAARSSADSAELGSYINLMNSGGPRTMTPPQVNCDTRQVGGYLRTTCN